MNQSEMRILSVNLGRATPLAKAKPSGVSGIYKLPTPEPVDITRLGIPGDAICDTENHGGVDQAVYLYGEPDYIWWSHELGMQLQPGTFGENLTVSGLESAHAWIGDRLAIGSVLLEVTSPRIPCVTLAARMGDPQFVKRFRRAERPGLYCRVLQEGSVQAGDEVLYTRYSGEAFPAIEMFRHFYEPQLDETTLRRHLAAPVHYKDRAEKERQLAALLKGRNRES